MVYSPFGHLGGFKKVIIIKVLWKSAAAILGGLSVVLDKEIHRKPPPPRRRASLQRTSEVYDHNLSLGERKVIRLETFTFFMLSPLD